MKPQKSRIVFQRMKTGIGFTFFCRASHLTLILENDYGIMFGVDIWNEHYAVSHNCTTFLHQLLFGLLVGLEHVKHILLTIPFHSFIVNFCGLSHFLHCSNIA